MTLYTFNLEYCIISTKVRGNATFAMKKENA